MSIAITAFALLGALCIFAVLLGLPGTWVMLALAIVLELADAWITGQPVSTFGGWTLAGVVALALVGEAIEFGSSALGIKTGGGTRRGMIGSVLGALGGGLLGTVFLPIPVLGTLAGVLLGTFAGAYVGETTGEDAKPGDEAMKPAAAATLARVVGIVVKGGVASAIWLILLASALL